MTKLDGTALGRDFGGDRNKYPLPCALYYWVSVEGVDDLAPFGAKDVLPAPPGWSDEGDSRSMTSLTAAFTCIH